jgi:hypothetical protein
MKPILMSLAVLTACSGLVAAETATLTAVADATLYEDVPLQAPMANGSGDYIFAGNTGSGEARRALIRFDLSSIPSGAVIAEARLTLRLSRTPTGDQPVALHRVTSAWSEGPSNPSAEEGRGATAQPGDATWSFRTYDTAEWGTPGGDFDPVASASITVGATLADYTWTGAGLAADVQAWVAGNAPNNGWIVIGNEAAPATAKRFQSRADPLGPPRLAMTFDLPAACVCERDGAAGVNVFDLLAYLDLWFLRDAGAEVDGAAGVDVFDLLGFLDCWFPASAGACP